LRNWAILGEAVPAAEAPALFPAPTLVPNGPAVRVVQHHPHGDAPDQNTLKLHVETTKQAKKHIAIENAYFVPPRELLDALVDASRRGVTIEVLTNSKQSSDMGFVVDAARYSYRDLVEAGVKIYEKQGTGTLHAKTLTADGQYSIVGSCNLNGRSHGRDTESVVAINDDKTASALATRFAEGVKDAKLITQQELDDASMLTELKQWTLSTLSWTI
jgi:cardiolipin synthase